MASTITMRTSSLRTTSHLNHDTLVKEVATDSVSQILPAVSETIYACNGTCLQQEKSISNLLYLCLCLSIYIWVFRPINAISRLEFSLREQSIHTIL